MEYANDSILMSNAGYVLFQKLCWVLLFMYYIKYLVQSKLIIT